ncbi:head morphogenesis protein [bacterium]|nr:MAG: head morphogenesis protein [bacterium]
MVFNFASVPFDEAIRFFRQKVNLPTEKWNDIWEGMHSRAFVVAGAIKSELLSDLRQAVDKGIAEGTTIAGFRKSFDDTVKRNGWDYKGGRGWRTGVIFDTNLRTAYAAGHYEQMTEPAVLSARPFWRYIGGLSVNPRPLHLQWNGTVLPADDPWWKEHYPPNGWGCKCKVVSQSQDELDRGGLSVSGKAPNDGHYEYADKTTGEITRVPNGIDPGWAYNPGRVAWGERISSSAMAGWKAEGAKAWERLTPGDFSTYDRPAVLPQDEPKASLGARAKTTIEVEGILRKLLGGEEKTFSFKNKGFRSDVLVNARTLAGHVDPARSEYLPFLPESLGDPYEVWLAFEKHKGTGQVVLRQRIIKVVKTGAKEGMLVVTNAVNGVMEAWTLIPVENLEYLNRQRVGRLVWKR